MTMQTLARNNALGAVDVYRRGLVAGTWTPDDSRRILSMQDDPDQLLELINEANTDPEIAAALQSMIDKASALFPPERRPPSR